MSKKENSRGWCFIILVLGLVLLLWYYYPIWSYMYKDSFFNSEFSEMGVFGDSYGALNTLFSALAFTGIIASIYFQQEELKTTRAELKASREEMKSQGEQFSQQTKAMQKQVFESSFFNMVELHNNISMSINSSQNYNFKIIFESLVAHAYIFDDYEISDADGWYYNKIKSAYDGFMADNYSTLGHYFRYLYQVVKFVDEAYIEKEHKVRYSNIIRAQLSNYELALLFVNCLCYERSGKFKVLMERYSFFEHVYDTDLETFIDAVNNNLIISDDLDECVQELTLPIFKKFYKLGAYRQVEIRLINATKKSRCVKYH